MRAEQQIIALATEKTAFGNPRKPLSRVDRASTGPVDLVTDRQKYEGLGMLALIIMPVLLVNVVIVTNLAGGFNHWDDLEPHIMSVLSQPPSIVLGVRNATGAFGFLVNNKYYLPLVNTRVTVEAVAVIPEHEFSFCAGIISGSLLDERLAGVCKPSLMGALGVTDDNGIASFPDLAIISGPPGAYTFNATAYLEGDDINPITNVRSASYIPMWSTIVHMPVLRNYLLEISPAREAPRAVEYNKLFDGTDLFCLNDLDTGVDTCAQADSPELLPPEASVSYSGSGVLDNATALTLFVVANFSEALLPNLVVTRTSDPQRVGSVDRMARLSWGAAGSNLVQAPLGDSGTVTFDKFRVLGANNPTLFLAYYCAGVFRLYNENWASEDRGGTMAALEITLLPPRGEGGVRAAQGDKWVGAQRGAQIDEISVAVGDATYLPQVELTDYPKEVVEGEEFSVYLNVYSFSYPRSRQRVFFVAGVTLFAECIPVDGIPATNAHDFQSYRKVLLGGASFVTTSEQAVFPTVSFSTQGMDGTYRIRIYSEGLFVAETVDIVVRSMVNYVRVGLPYSLQALYGDPGCAAEWAPAVMDNSIEDDQAICLSLPTFAPLQGGLPYVDAFVCNVPLKANEKASLAQSCVPVTGKRVRVSMLSGTAKTDAVPLNFFPGTVERRWDFAGTDMALGNVTWTSGIGIRSMPPSPNGRYQITHLSNNNVMNGAIPTFVKFSVGGVDSATVIAIEPADLEKVQDVVQYCGAYAPVAHIEILNYASRPTSTYPGNEWILKAMAIDILGQPAVGRTLCIKGFDLDWTNPISAQVEFRDNLDLLELEQQRNAYTTLTNQTYHNSSCFVTGSDGIGTLDWFWDSPGWKWKMGPRAWYIEAAERKAGQKYRRFGTRFVLDYAWGSHDREISCIEAALSVSVPAARTESYFVNLHTPWTANELTGTDPLAPTAVLSTARFGAAGTLSGTSVLPHKSTWYGRTDSRMVEPDTLTTFYMRVYRGTAVTDEALYPANLDVRSFLISGPPGFPLRKCMALEMEMSNNTDHCWTSDDFSLETWRRTFIHGYVQFRVRIGRRVMGRYTIVTTIGGKYASNHFSQTFEFEVADIRSYPTCEVAAAEPSIAPALKTVESCANAFPDGACTWIDKACLPLATLVTLQRDLPSASPPRCVPLGAALPGIISATIKSEHGVPTAGRYLAVRSAGVVVHPPAIGPSLSDGIVNSSQVFLDYAAPGDYRLALSLYNLAPEFLLPALDGQPPVLLAEVRVADRLRGSFDVNPPPLVPKHTLLPCIVVRLTIQRRCPEVDTMLFPTAHDWVPPPIELVWRSISGNVSNNGSLGLILEGHQAAPSVVVAQQEACASFCSLRVVAARTDEYIIDVRVQGTEDVLASSTPVRLVGWGRSMEIMKGVPLEVDSDAALQLSVLVRGADGSPVQDKLVEASIEAAFPSQAMDAGYVGDSRNNVSAEIYSEGSLGVSGVDGVVDMTLWLKRWVAGGPVVIRVKSLLAADVVSTPFIVKAPVAMLEIMAQPTPAPIQSAEWVWPLLTAKNVEVTLNTALVFVGIKIQPSEMKGTVVGEAGEGGVPGEVVLRVTDYRGVGMDGLEWNVTLMDSSDKIVDAVLSAVTSFGLAEDYGISREGPTCSAASKALDCKGLYGFGDRLAVNNWVKTGFYRFRFICQGYEIIQPIDIMMKNEYLPNVLFLDLYMLASLSTVLLTFVILNIVKEPPLYFDVNSAQYQTPRTYHFVKSFPLMCLVGFMGYISYLFYTTSELTKTPPHEMNGYLLLSDYIAKYMVASLFIVAVLEYLRSTFYIPRVPKPGRSRQLENTVRKLGRDARLEIAKRTYVGDVRQPMDKPPNVDYTGRMGKVQEWWDTQKRKWPAYNRWKLRLFHMQNAFIIGVKTTYIKAKYSIPVFDNLYFGWTDIFYGQRFLATMVLIGFMIMTCLGLGIWAGQKLVKTLTEYYSYYNFLFAFEKVADPSTVDWFEKFSTLNGGRGQLNGLQEAVVLFIVRTSPGLPFFKSLRDASGTAALLATITTTTLFCFGIFSLIIKVRRTLVLMRTGEMPVPPKKLRLVDSCAYLGVQGVLVMFGCGFLFLVSFAIFFILLWRTDFTNRLGALWVPLFVFAMLLYGVMLYLSRVRVRRNPGLMIQNRSAWALGELLETTLHLGTSLFTMPVRCAIGAVRQLATWFWLHNARHEAHSGMPTLYGGLGNSLFDASLYVQHQHNNPVVRVMVDRIHRELRNHDTLRRFSPANIEPLRLRRETLEHRAHHDTTRVKAKLVLLLLTKANPHLSLEKLRKHYVAKAVAADKLLDDD